MRHVMSMTKIDLNDSLRAIREKIGDKTLNLLFALLTILFSLKLYIAVKQAFF